MRKGIHISLRAGERLYVNGAVLRVDRKVSVEFLNDVTFLLEHHVMHEEETKTPLRAHYFLVQTMLIDPSATDATLAMFKKSHALVRAAFEDECIRTGLDAACDLVAANKVFEALKTIRNLFALEDAILCKGNSDNQQREVASCR